MNLEEATLNALREDNNEYEEYMAQQKALADDYCQRVTDKVTPDVIRNFGKLKEILEDGSDITEQEGYYFPEEAINILKNTDRRHNLNGFMDLTIADILNMVSNFDTPEEAIEDLFNEYKPDSALTWGDNFVTVLSQLVFNLPKEDLDYKDFEESKDLPEIKMKPRTDDGTNYKKIDIYVDGKYWCSTNTYKTIKSAIENISKQYPELAGREVKGYFTESKKVKTEDIEEHNLSKDLFGAEAERRLSQEQKDLQKDLQYVRDIMAGKEVIDDKYHEKLSLDTAKKWLRKDFVNVNCLASADPDDIDKKLAKEYPDIFGKEVKTEVSKNIRTEIVKLPNDAEAEIEYEVDGNYINRIWYTDYDGSCQFSYDSEEDQFCLFPNENFLTNEEEKLIKEKVHQLIDKKEECNKIITESEEVEYMSKEEFDKLPKDYKSTVGETIKTAAIRGEDPEALKAKYKEMGYEESDPMVLANENGGTVLKPVKITESYEANKEYEVKYITQEGKEECLHITPESDMTTPQMITKLKEENKDFFKLLECKETKKICKNGFKALLNK